MAGIEERKSCQICERSIKANTGVIAHHGYQRPNRGSGWQTPSCWGARRLPYEQSADALPEYILHVKGYVSNQKKLVKELMANPPETLYYRYSGFDKNPKPLTRPEGFDAKANLERGAHSAWSYESEHASQVRFHEREVKNGTKEIERAEKRLSDWKPATV